MGFRELGKTFSREGTDQFSKFVSKIPFITQNRPQTASVWGLLRLTSDYLPSSMWSGVDSIIFSRSRTFVLDRALLWHQASWAM